MKDQSLLIPFDAVEMATGAAPATGVYVDGAGRFGIAADSARFAVTLNAETARSIAVALNACADILDHREGQIAADAARTLAELTGGPH